MASDAYCDHCRFRPWIASSGAHSILPNPRYQQQDLLRSSCPPSEQALGQPSSTQSLGSIAYTSGAGVGTISPYTSETAMGRISSTLAREEKAASSPTLEEDMPSELTRRLDEAFSHFSHSSRERFPAKLYAMLEVADERGLTCAAWLPHGRAFLVRDEGGFMRDLVSRFLRQTKIRSFYRQLSMWGFKRLPEGNRDAGAWHHEHFLRGSAEEMKRMVRTKAKRSDAPDDRSDGPDFYGMPPIVPVSDGSAVAKAGGTPRRVTLDSSAPSGSEREDTEKEGLRRDRGRRQPRILRDPVFYNRRFVSPSPPGSAYPPRVLGERGSRIAPPSGEINRGGARNASSTEPPEPSSVDDSAVAADVFDLEPLPFDDEAPSFGDDCAHYIGCVIRML